MPYNMSYCMAENTAGALDELLEKFREGKTFEEFSDSEQNSLKQLKELCEEFLVEAENFG